MTATMYPTPYTSPGSIFTSTATPYVRYRPPHPPIIIDLLAHLATEHMAAPRMLDLGCGPGSVALELTKRGVDVIAVDPSPEMIAASRAAERERGLTGTQWCEGTAENVASLPGVAHMSGTVIADAFHWMAREQVLDQLDAVTASGGFVAVVCSRATGTARPWWHEVIGQIRARFLGSYPAAGPHESYREPGEDHESVLRRSRFSKIAVTRADYRISFTTDELVGSQLSYAYSSPAVLGEQRDRFEDTVRTALLAVEPSGRFEARPTAALIIGWRG